MPFINAEENCTPKELNLCVYTDGIVEVRYELDVNPILARVNITLFGRTYENFIIKDQDKFLLDYNIHEDYTTIDILGSQSVNIVYLTPGLTNKTRATWSLSLHAPIDVNIRLPEGATIINLQPMPLAISIIGKTANLMMPMGEIRITYIVGIVGTKEHARVILDDAEEIIEEIKTEGINVEEAETLLQQAREAYDEERYIEAEQCASQAKSSATNARFLAEEALTTLETAESAINLAENMGRTSLLKNAKEELNQAKQAFNSGDYNGAKSIAEQAIIIAEESEKPTIRPTITIIALIGTVAMVILIIGFKFIRKKTALEVTEPKLTEEKLKFDLDLLFKQNPQLRWDDKEVIRYICESGGVYASELRQRFDLPKSSAWRMIRRLEHNNIIKSKKVGRETFVQISEKYGVNNQEKK